MSQEVNEFSHFLAKYSSAVHTIPPYRLFCFLPPPMSVDEHFTLKKKDLIIHICTLSTGPVLVFLPKADDNSGELEWTEQLNRVRVELYEQQLWPWRVSSIFPDHDKGGRAPCVASLEVDSRGAHVLLLLSHAHRWRRRRLLSSSCSHAPG